MPTGIASKGWGRTRGSGATLAAPLQATQGSAVAAATVRRWRPESGGVGQRAQRVANDDDPHRRERVARLRCHHAPLPAPERMVGAEARALHLLPTVGAAWRPPGTPAEGLTPGKQQQPARAGARHLTTGQGL